MSTLAKKALGISGIVGISVALPPPASKRHFENSASLPWRRGRWCEVLLVASLCLVPGTVTACNSCHGHILNACRFYSMGNVPFLINLALIILVEAAMIRLFVRGMTCLRSLLAACALNLVSSAALSGLFLIIGNQFDPFWSWHDSLNSHFLGTPLSGFLDKVVPMLWILCMALATEWPLLRWMAARRDLSWKRLMLVVVAMNSVSGIAMFIAEPPMMRAWYAHLARVDQSLLQAWQSRELLRQTSGRIYTVGEEVIQARPGESSAGFAGLTINGEVMTGRSLKYGLRYFDLADGCWHAVTNLPSLHPALWSLAKDRLAFFDGAKIRVCDYPAFKPVLDLAVLTNQVERLQTLALSDDARMLAVVLADACVSRPEGFSAERRFLRYELVVFDAESGALVSRCPRWALGTSVFWMPDSRQLLFSSLSNTNEFEKGVSPLEYYRATSGGEIRYGVAPAAARGLYCWRTSTSEVSRFGDDLGVVSRSGPYLIARRHSRFRTPRVELLHLPTRQRRSVVVDGLGGWNPLVQMSPDGKFLCLELRLARNTCHAIMSVEQPSRRHVISATPLLAWPVSALNFVWMPEP